jgi:hypothetical protein
MIGSPGDATVERQAVTDAILRWNASTGREKGVFIEPVKWETHATPGLQGRPQGMINEELIPLSDLLIAIFKGRAGSPTGVEISGTIEEIREFQKAGKYVAVYFYEGEVSLGDIDPDQLKKVREFKAEVRKNGLTDDFRTADELKEKLAHHFSAILTRLPAPAAEQQPPPGRLPGERIPAAAEDSRDELSGDEADSQQVIDTSGSWLLLDERFYEARSVRTGTDGVIAVTIPSRSAEADAALSALHPHGYGRSRPIPYAYRNDAWLVTVKAVESESAGDETLWTVRLVPESIDYGGGFMEMSFNTGGRTYSADRLAEMRARRILLNDPPAIDENDRGDFEGAALEAFVRGSNVPVPAKVCFLRQMYSEHREKSAHFLRLARLGAIFFLKGSGAVEQVLELALGPFGRNGVHVRFRGRRQKKYDNVEPTVIEFEGDCPLE